MAGFFGMKTATYASARTTQAVRTSLNSGLQVAFRSGAVMGLVVVGLALLDISAWYLILNYFIDDADAGHKLIMITTTMLTFGMGASTQALLPVWEEEFIPKLPMWCRLSRKSRSWNS